MRARTRFGLKYGAAALALTFGMGIAQAGDHPGANWQITSVKVTTEAGGSSGGALSRTLREANDIYFYGDMPAVMHATVRADGKVDLTIRDRLSGAVLTRASGLNAGPGGDLKKAVLTWMDGLDCGDTGCRTTVARATPDATPVPEVSRNPGPSYPQSVSGTGTNRIAARPVPIPQPKPQPGLARTALTRNPDAGWDGFARTRISRLGGGFDPDLSYGAADEIFLGDQRFLRSGVGRLPPSPGSRNSSTVLERMFSDFVGIFSPQPTPVVATTEDVQTPEKVVAAPAPRGATALENRAAARRAPAVALAPAEPFRPSKRWRLAAAQASGDILTDAAIAPQRFVSVGEAYQVREAVSSPVPAQTGSLAVPGLGSVAPDLSGESGTPVVVLDQRGPAAATPNTGKLSVKLHPSVFAGKSQTLMQRLQSTPSARSRQARLAASARSSAPEDTNDPIVTALAARGLALDTDTYAVRERIYWGGKTGSQGFWISLPRFIESGLVLIATESRSVVADVRNRAGPVRISDKIAEEMQLKPGSWTQLQIIALRRIRAEAPTVAAVE